MAWTQAQYEKLCAAIALGYKKVRYSAGNEVEYQDAGQMMAVKREMEAALGLDSTGQPRSTTSFDRAVGVYDSGLH